eukprot:scaffold2044_cov202-Prasinococcus_capsulatus_cf.AAC.9
MVQPGDGLQNVRSQPVQAPARAGCRDPSGMDARQQASKCRPSPSVAIPQSSRSCSVRKVECARCGTSTSAQALVPLWRAGGALRRPPPPPSARCSTSRPSTWTKGLSCTDSAAGSARPPHDAAAPWPSLPPTAADSPARATKEDAEQAGHARPTSSAPNAGRPPTLGEAPLLPAAIAAILLGSIRRAACGMRAFCLSHADTEWGSASRAVARASRPAATAAAQRWRREAVSRRR